MTCRGRSTASLLLSALLTSSCGDPPGPPERFGFYNLFLSSIQRDFPNQRYYACEVSFELDIKSPLPDSFETVADAHVRRSVQQNSGGQVAEDAVIREIPIRMERLPLAEAGSFPPDSVRITLGGALAGTIYGTGFGGAEGYYDGQEAWSCPVTLPPLPSDALREQGYPAADLDPGDFHVYANFPVE